MGPVQGDPMPTTVPDSAYARPGLTGNTPRVSALTPAIRVEPTSAEEPAAAQVVFDIEGLSVRYGSHVAIKGASFVVNKSEITAFIGPSG